MIRVYVGMYIDGTGGNAEHVPSIYMLVHSGMYSPTQYMYLGTYVSIKASK
jgi:hypothetical protein